MPDLNTATVEVNKRSAPDLSAEASGYSASRYTFKPGYPALWAILLFLTLNAALSLSTILSKQSIKKPEQQGATFQACDSAIDQFQRATDPAQIVLIGSSVLMAPVWSTDIKRYPDVADVYHHHRSFELERLLSQKGLAGKKVFAFALPGLMVSDGYLLTSKLLEGARKPEMLVYGVTPRDFMDDLMTGETRTPVFQRLVHLEDLSSLGDMYLTSTQEKADFLVNNLVFLYGKRWRYQDKTGAIVKRIVSTLVPVPEEKSTDSASTEQQFLLGKDKKRVWRKSIEEYRARYRHFDAAQFAKQEHFLESLVDLSNHRKIEVVLLNMPLSADNIALLPTGFYEHYRSVLRALSTNHNCRLLDLQDDRKFTDSDFYDTVHLNAAGGQSCLQRLADWIATSPNYLVQRK